ncbi:MAG: hypothetical protein NVS3B3_21460 [Aquirhabdus sp.]
MALSGDLKFKLIVYGAAFTGAVLLVRYGVMKFSGVIPQVVKDGVEAAGLIGGNAVNMVTDPADAFGISPAKDKSGNPKWEKTTPWESNDPTVNNDAGINYGLF